MTHKHIRERQRQLSCYATLASSGFLLIQIKFALYVTHKLWFCYSDFKKPCTVRCFLCVSFITCSGLMQKVVFGVLANDCALAHWSMLTVQSSAVVSDPASLSDSVGRDSAVEFARGRVSTSRTTCTGTSDWHHRSTAVQWSQGESRGLQTEASYDTHDNTLQIQQK